MLQREGAAMCDVWLAQRPNSSSSMFSTKDVATDLVDRHPELVRFTFSTGVRRNFRNRRMAATPGHMIILCAV
jgi:hypothetical protein